MSQNVFTPLFNDDVIDRTDIADADTESTTGDGGYILICVSYDLTLLLYK